MEIGILVYCHIRVHCVLTIIILFKGDVFLTQKMWRLSLDRKTFHAQ